MQRLLAIESATDWLSLALLEGEEVVALRAHADTRQHTSVLLPLLDEMLADAAWRLDQLDAMAVSTGPGSFTSLRIGIATVKGLAFGRTLQTIGISTLEAMAASCLDVPTGEQGEAAASGRQDREVVALLDARRGEWYAGGWRVAAGAARGDFEATLPEGLYSPAQLAQEISADCIAICPEPEGWQAEFEAVGRSFSRVVTGEAARPRADRVGRLAQRRLARGEGVPAELLSARYLRRAQAEAQRLGGPVEAGEVARVDAD